MAGAPDIGAPAIVYPVYIDSDDVALRWGSGLISEAEPDEGIDQLVST